MESGRGRGRKRGRGEGEREGRDKRHGEIDGDI